MSACWTAGSAQQWFRACVSRLSSLWRPAPYAYLDDATAHSSTHALQPQPSPSQLQDTSAAALVHQPVRHQRHNSQHPPFASSSRLHRSGLRHCRSLQHLEPWPSEDADVAEGSAQQRAQAAEATIASPLQHRAVEQQQSSNSRQRWQWFRGLHIRPRDQQIRGRAGDSAADERALLHRVKDVLPHLSDAVILAELSNTLDADEAVENLLSA